MRDGDTEKNALLNKGPDSDSQDGATCTEHAKSSFLLNISVWQRIQLVCMTLTEFLVGSNFSLAIPFFPEMAAKKGLGPVSVGIVFSCYELVFLLATPLYGKGIGKIGVRFLYFSGILFCAVGSALFGVLEYCPPGQVFLAMSIITRSIEALGGSAFTTCGMTIVSAMFPHNTGVTKYVGHFRLTHNLILLGLLFTSHALGYMLGPIIGGALYQASGYMMTFVYAACPLLVAGLAVTGLMRVNQDVSGNSAPMFRFMFTPKTMMLSLIPFLLGGFGFGFIGVMLSLHLRQFRLAPLMKGLMFLPLAGSFCIFTSVWGCLTDKYPHRAYSMIGVLVCMHGMACLLLGPAPFFTFLPRNTIWLLILSLILIGICQSIVPSTYSQFMVTARKKGYPDELATRGMVSATFNALRKFG